MENEIKNIDMHRKIRDFELIRRKRLLEKEEREEGGIVFKITF